MGNSTDKYGGKSYTVEPGTKEIENKAFCGCYDLEEIEIPDFVLSIGEDAFADCINLKRIKIPSTVMAIRKRAFRGCSSLKRIKIPSLVREIEEEAFMDCCSLEDFNFMRGLLLREPLRAAAA